MDNVDDLPFEKALEELEAILEKLEGEGLTLDETVTLYQRGRLLAQRCQAMLDTVALRVEQLAAGEDGEDRAVPFADGQPPAAG
jgi:exodeoxyribonuclease VII small subunit